MLTECLSEEETSAAVAIKPFTSLRRCSVRGRVGINPVFCAVSIKSSHVICFIRLQSAVPLIKWQGGMQSIQRQSRKVSISGFFTQAAQSL